MCQNTTLNAETVEEHFMHHASMHGLPELNPKQQQQQQQHP